jgi:hypothetical protein
MLWLFYIYVNKIRITLASDPEVPFCLELMAERKRRGQLLKCSQNPSLYTFCYLEEVLYLISIDKKWFISDS